MDFSSLLAFFETSKYVLLFIGCYIEGTVVMLGAGILWHAGTVSFWPAYIALLTADFLSDLMWYAIGYFGARRTIEKWGHHAGLTHENIAKVERRFHEHHTWILLVSKLSMGFGLAVATLTTAGMLRVPLYRYVVINLMAGIAWVFIVMMIGYYFGNVLEYLPVQLKIAFALTALVLIFFGLRALSIKLAKSDW